MDSEGIIFILIAGGFLTLIGSLFVFAYLQGKKRTEALQAVANSLDMRFSSAKRKPTELGLAHMTLFSKGRSRKAYNIISGTFADAECRMFDYRYTTGSGKHSRTHQQTVVAFKVPGAQIPQFTCKPEHFFHKFADMFGFEDINFEEYPIFSKAYRLNGEDETRIRTIFTAEAIHLLETETKKPWSIDGAGDWLVVHRPGVTVKPPECSEFLLGSTTLLNAMTL